MTRSLPTALAAVKAIADASLTAEALVRACLDRIAEREPELHAWSHLAADQALAAARALDRGSGGGPLKGLPIGVKDIIDTAGMPTTYGSAIYREHVPARDASCVSLSREAGGIILGKTVSTEFAYFCPGPTANPHNPGHTPGGSSSGSAAAVGAGTVPLAFATQTAGSVIRPAAFCGCVGYKPSFGLLDMAGIRPVAPSLDTLGVLAANLADAAFFASVLSARPRLRVDGRDWAKPRIALYRTPDWGLAEPAMQERLEEIAGRLSWAGCAVTELVLPAPFDRLVQAQKDVMAYEMARTNHAEIRTSPDLVSPQLRALVETGTALAAEAYDAARALASLGLAAFAAATHGVDVVLTLAAPGEAPAGLAATGDPVFNRVWTLLGVPCVGLPCGFGPRGLPLAVQLVGRLGEDAKLLDHAAWIERALTD